MAKRGKAANPDPMTRAGEQIAAARDEILKPETLEALQRIRPEELIAPDSDPELLKGTAHRSGGWMHSPALLDIFAVTDRRMTRLAKQMGMEGNRVERVHARLVPNADLLILKPALPTDKTAIPVNRYGNKVTINLVSLLGEHGLTVESGYRQRYDIDLIPKGNPHAPGLIVDLSDVKERRQTRRSNQSTPDNPE